MTEPVDRSTFADELKRTAFQKNAVSKKKPAEVLEFAVGWFKERGYRAGPAARPNHIFIMGGKEGVLPRVTGEVSARADVGKPGTTLVTVDAAGEKLGPAMAEFLKELRAWSRVTVAPPE
jgi:hypothetical protein